MLDVGRVCEFNKFNEYNILWIKKIIINLLFL